MPTTRPRHLITETDEIAAALDAAARRWPEERSRSKLLQHLVAAGHDALQASQQNRRQGRLEAIRRTSGALAGAYGPDYLSDLRADWPE